MGLLLEPLREAVCRVARDAAARGLVANDAGNYSARDPASGRIAITPTAFPYDRMRPDHIVVVDPDGQVVDGDRPPSSETPVHCTIYRHRPDLHGIVHTEPAFTNAFGIVGRPIPAVLVNLLLAVGGEVPVVPFAPSGSTAFGDALLPPLAERYAVIWANHGLLTVGHSVDDAYRRTIVVEAGAHAYHLALQVGTPHVLDRPQLDGHDQA